jgi:hypothetical protein
VNPGGVLTTSELFRKLVDVELSVLVLRQNRLWVVHVVKLVDGLPAVPFPTAPALFVLATGTTLDQSLRSAVAQAKGRGWLP